MNQPLLIPNEIGVRLVYRQIVHRLWILRHPQRFDHAVAAIRFADVLANFQLADLLPAILEGFEWMA